MKIIMTIGLPASGKSTWAREFIKENKDFVIISKDNFRNEVLLQHGKKWSRENEDLYVLPHWIKLINDTLKSGKSVISEDTNLAKRNRLILKELSIKHKVELQEKSFLDVPIEVCIDRDSKRESSFKVGREKINQMYKTHILPELRKISHENLSKVCKTYDESDNKKTIICDIDGTVALIGDRSPFEWQKVDLDKPINQVLDVLKSLQKAMNYKLIFVSGRDEECREKTETWLQNVAQISFDALYMRKNKDYRGDYLVKEEIYQTILKEKYNIAFVIDDRPQVVKVWKKLGLFVFDVNQSGLEF